MKDFSKIMSILVKNIRIINPAKSQDFVGSILVDGQNITEIGTVFNTEARNCY